MVCAALGTSRTHKNPTPLRGNAQPSKLNGLAGYRFGRSFDTGVTTTGYKVDDADALDAAAAVVEFDIDATSGLLDPDVEQVASLLRDGAVGECDRDRPAQFGVIEAERRGVDLTVLPRSSTDRPILAVDTELDQDERFARGSVNARLGREVSGGRVIVVMAEFAVLSLVGGNGESTDHVLRQTDENYFCLIVGNCPRDEDEF